MITPSIHPHTFAPTLKAALQRLLDDPLFLPRGGHLGFCLSHRYPCELDKCVSKGIEREELQMRLKGSDAIVSKVCAELGLKGSLKYLVEDTYTTFKKDGQKKQYVAYVMMNYAVDTTHDYIEDDMLDHLRNLGGKLITPIPPADRAEYPELPQEPAVLVR